MRISRLYQVNAAHPCAPVFPLALLVPQTTCTATTQTCLPWLCATHGCSVRLYAACILAVDVFCCFRSQPDPHPHTPTAVLPAQLASAGHQAPCSIRPQRTDCAADSRSVWPDHGGTSVCAAACIGHTWGDECWAGERSAGVSCVRCEQCVVLQRQAAAMFDLLEGYQRSGGDRGGDAVGGSR
jgi:hypothetical protein